MTEHNSDAAVEVKGLTKSFRSGHGRRRSSFRAVDDVSFEVADGRCLALVGESGSGKTTVARVLVGLEPADEGDVRLHGSSVTVKPGRRERRTRAREVQMVFQDPNGSLNRRRTAGSAIREVLDAHHDLSSSQAQDRVVELLEQVGMRPDMAKSYPAQLSGGQLQRVAIARALAAEPKTLVLDEAVASLDVSVQAQVLNLLADLREEYGLTYLFITHDLAVVRQISDDVLVMRHGRIVERGSTRDVLDDPQEPYTVLLRNSAPRPGWRPAQVREDAEKVEQLDRDSDPVHAG